MLWRRELTDDVECGACPFGMALFAERFTSCASPLVAQFQLSPAQKIAVGSMCGSFDLTVHVTEQLFKVFAIRACGRCLSCWTISGTSAHGGEKKGHLAVPCHRRHLSSFTARTDYQSIPNWVRSDTTTSVLARLVPPLLARFKRVVDELKLLLAALGCT